MSLTGLKDLDALLFLKLKKRDLINAMLINKNCYFLIKSFKFWRNKLAYDFPLKSKFLTSNYHKKLYKDNPKKLYCKINRKAIELNINYEDYNSKDKNKKQLNSISVNKILKILHKRFPDFVEKDKLRKNERIEIANILTKNLKFSKLLYGDIVSLTLENLYAYFIWNGEKINILEKPSIKNEVRDIYEVYFDYIIPKEICFPEFSLNHYEFIEILEENTTTMNLPKEIIDEIAINFNIDTQKSYFLDYDEKIFVRTVNKNKITKEQFIEEITKHPFISNYDDIDLGLNEEYFIGRYMENFFEKSDYEDNYSDICSEDCEE